MLPQTLIIARDPGAANALAPVARSGPATVIGLGHGRRFFERAGMACVGPEDDALESEAGRWLDEIGPQVLLTGTSLKVAQDARWWRAARARGIPSLALLDHWTAYRERFSQAAPFDSLPDRVAVMDENARRRMEARGCPPERLLIGGQPALDALIAEEVPGRTETRQHWGAGAGEWVIVFASEPQAHDHGNGLGYTEVEALQMLMEALPGRAARLIVKLHPRETPERLKALVAGGPVPAQFETELTPRAALAGADTVVGMTSIFLLEAALSGRPVLSVQPGQVMEWTEFFPGLVTVARSGVPCRDWLTNPAHSQRLSATARAARNAAAGFTGHAVEQVWSLISQQSR